MHARTALAALLLAAAAPPAAARAPRAPVALEPCQLGSEAMPRRLPARCGTFTVPEDHDRPGGRTIGLRVAIVEAESPDARPDPIVFLAGGPGQAATELWPAVERALGRAARTRDVVLLDQRGTGASAPLTCAALEDLPDDDDGPRGDEELVRRLAACGAELSARADLSRYRTADLVADLERLRAAFGWERWNLVGGSYGTRAALAYARAHPGRVRSMVLDGVVPFEMAVGADFAVDMERALELAFARCAADAACHAAFPDPRGDLAALLARYDGRPERLTPRDPLTGRRRALTVDGDSLRGLAGYVAYLPEAVSLLPLLLQQGREGDLSALVAFGLAGRREAASGISRTLQLAVLCVEDVPFYPPAAPRPLLREGMREYFAKACAAFPHGPPDPAFRAPARLEIPALLLSGEADPVTPPRWAEVAARHLPRARHLVLAGMGHGTLHRGCVPRLVERFLEAGSAEGLDASCLEAVKPQPFFLDQAGPLP